MKEQILNISGRRSVSFPGELLAIASTRDTSEQTRFRWEAARVYKVDPAWIAAQKEKTGKDIAPYRVGTAELTIRELERDEYRVFHAWNKQKALDFVRRHTPSLEYEIAIQLGLENAPTGSLAKHESGRSHME